MRNWDHIVHSRLAPLGLDAMREQDIRAELAEHLEDAYAAARSEGVSEEDAVARAMAQVPDWTELARTIRRADEKEGPMSHDMKTLCVPGLTALCCAAALMLGVTVLFPSELWLDPRASVRLAIAGLWMSSYLAFGALGAWLSRRAGGSMRTRFVAGIFPMALHLAIYVPLIALGLMAQRALEPARAGVNFQPRIVLIFLILPAVALALGTLPFLRHGDSRRLS